MTTENRSTSRNGVLVKRLLSRASAAESMILRVGGVVTDDGRTFDTDAKLFRAAASALSETAMQDAERWRFCMENGFPRACYNPPAYKTYFYIRADVGDEKSFWWDTPEKAVDETMRIMKGRTALNPAAAWPFPKAPK